MAAVLCLGVVVGVWGQFGDTSPRVRHQFPDVGQLVRGLRDTACADPGCGCCRERHDARKELSRWFGFDDFRPEPADESGPAM